MTSTQVDLPQESQKDQSQIPNNFKHPEFAGPAGERKLKSTLRKILPLALFETWQVLATENQAPGNDAYLSIAKLAEARQRTDRKIRLDLAELEARRMLVIRHEWKMLRQPDGSFKPRLVTVKDFERLYDLAHEYLLWENSEWYIEPSREYVEVIRENEVLIKKLRRFDNYRRILCNRQPGPVTQEKEIHRWYKEETHPQGDIQKVVEDVRDVAGDTTESVRNLYLQEYLQEELQKDSPNNEVTNSNHNKQEEMNSNGMAIVLGGMGGLAVATIGNPTELIPENEGTESLPQHSEQTQQTENRKEEGKMPPADLQNGRVMPERYKKTPRLTIEGFIRQYVPILNDHQAMQEEKLMQSNITRAINLFEKRGVWTQEQIAEVMGKAFNDAHKLPEEKVEAVNQDNSKNRMRFFYYRLGKRIEKFVPGASPTVQELPTPKSNATPKTTSSAPRCAGSTSGMNKGEAEALADEINLGARALGVTTKVIPKEGNISVVVLTWRGISMEMLTPDQWRLTQPILARREEKKRQQEQGGSHATI